MQHSHILSHTPSLVHSSSHKPIRLISSLSHFQFIHPFMPTYLYTGHPLNYNRPNKQCNTHISSPSHIPPLSYTPSHTSYPSTHPPIYAYILIHRASSELQSSKQSMQQEFRELWDNVQELNKMDEVTPLVLSLYITPL